MDNLESQTYEVFEKDPIKYSQYQQVSRQHSGSVVSFVYLMVLIWLIYTLPQAVYKCLLDRVPEEQKETNIQ